MELKPVSPTTKTPAANFTGDVYLTPVYRGTEPSRMTVALVRFTPGAHTNWHSHAVGQTLHVTEGVGLVGIRDGSVLRIRAGDTVICPPGEEHWHGAAADTFMSHLAMLEAVPGAADPTTWLEPVSSEHYKQATEAV
jgi:quercetin dioxygenase-like cupin family protein